MRPKKKVKTNEKTSKEVMVPDGIEGHEEQEVIEVEGPKGKRKEMAAKPNEDAVQTHQTLQGRSPAARHIQPLMSTTIG